MIINGHNLHIEQFGPQNGPAVVLLHHGLGSVKAWQKQNQVLADVGYRVVVYDRWGYGGSDSRPRLDVPTFATDIDDLLLLLRQLGIERVALVGHSDGGTIALYMAARYPEMIKCLVTIAAHIYVEPKMETGILSVKRAFEEDERFRKGMQFAHGEKYREVMRNWFDGWNRNESLDWDMRPILRTIRCPTLVVQGEKDEHATPQHARDIAKAIPGAQIWLIPGAMHMLPRENQGRFTPRLLEFLEKYYAIKSLIKHQ